jgi:hypothetical protein
MKNKAIFFGKLIPFCAGMEIGVVDAIEVCAELGGIKFIVELPLR